VTQFLHFFCKLPQIRTSNFHKVVQQHTEGVVRNIVWVLLEIYFFFSSDRILKIRLELIKVVAMSLVYYFLGTQCRCPPAHVMNGYMHAVFPHIKTPTFTKIYTARDPKMIQISRHTKLQTQPCKNNTSWAIAGTR